MRGQRERLLTMEGVVSRLRVSESSVRRLIAAGLFPDAFCVTEGKAFWLESDVEAYLHLRSRIGKLWPEPKGKADAQEEKEDEK